ncbi:UDP-glycosyltransferase 91A1 [Camellia lanceoleosa]|uniref:UDP-glycosyltransferase 91A1 n=1 Tax=Camellia lanceoleosa TaxID=1840588 RepID=A0ACC0HWA8_9ERIC|nr:UDP-glycosyltransferase 91A1 [Camellia lanceoleosa]
MALEPHLTSMADDGKLHIVMVPWLVFGYMIPYLELTKLVAQKGHKVSFVSTAKNIDRLPKLPPSLSSLLNFVKLPLPLTENLPENADANSDLPYDKVQYLKITFDSMQESMAHFLEASDPDWLLYDFAPYWLGPIAAKLNISSAFFTIMIAACMGFLGPSSAVVHENDDRNKAGDYTVPPKWVSFPSTVAFRLYEVLRMTDSFMGNDSGVSNLHHLAASAKGCDVLAVRSCSEFEPEWLQVLEEIHEKPIFPVGQLPTTAYDEGDDDNNKDARREMKEWLDKQDKGSMVYVAFGSDAKPTQHELTEIALGLELSQLPFFWVLRKRRGLVDTELIELLDGFEERTKGVGVICTSWVPQLKILSHDLVGGFLTHSGWSSVVEAIQFERDLILLTCLADHGLNARLLEEKKIAYSIPRDERDRSFTRDSVAESLRLVIVDEERDVYRDRVKEMKGLFGSRDKQERFAVAEEMSSSSEVSEESSEVVLLVIGGGARRRRMRRV